MTEHTIQTISMAYSAYEDRLEFRCKSGEQSYQLWLTQRMWRQLIQPVVKWLADSGVGAEHTRAFMQDSFASNTAEPVTLDQSLGAPIESPTLSKENVADSASQVAAPMTQKWIKQPWVCSTANLQMSKDLIRVRFESEQSDHCYIFSMSVLEASHFLMAQYNTLKKSGWSFDWPGWLCTDDDQTEQSDVVLLH